MCVIQVNKYHIIMSYVFNWECVFAADTTLYVTRCVPVTFIQFAELLVWSVSSGSCHS